jgi:hypothetical protein
MPECRPDRAGLEHRMRVAERFNGLAGLERHQKVGAILAALCMFAMALGLTPGSSMGQLMGAIVVVAAFSSVIALAVGAREERGSAGVAGRIEPQQTSSEISSVTGRRAA